MKLKESKIEYDSLTNFGTLYYSIELSEFGIDKDMNQMFDLSSAYKNIKFKGNLLKYDEELNKLINKLIKFNPLVNIVLEFNPVRRFKSRKNIKYNLLIQNYYKYDDKIIDYYKKFNSKFIVTDVYANDFYSLYFIPKEKIYILMDILEIDKIKEYKLKNFNFLYDFTIINED